MKKEKIAKALKEYWKKSKNSNKAWVKITPKYIKQK